ncbi:RagB/SusD family nutrient uptake outer membrane protein [Parabacteroides sp. BX2]|jgi:starch-binding outer membrane protein, SusD/RagB family|uniref:RagB/SusD family nutrient uptake outer membrane protein n=1 Tax=Parabacteroides segnis TaxID=2763058 RepID=A0ABR7E6Y9_9BACT|nr:MULTISPECIES: RagB/SusD family nutrient uptake outer membrane protein [Parabacteroides]MBC5645413.1 RagB/SusD family nutrient uptake outer membrane protein [Parabacteroides segnis]MCM0715265.1 RagB/SusD family nutrient uptake outer membrane protein [Parabacteroides sp. TA-V-105]
MKKRYLTTIAFCAAASLFNSCIEETFPTDVASTEQVAESTTALEALANATAAHMNAYNILNASSAGSTDYGYPAIMTSRDVMCNDFPVSKTGYDYFNNPWASTNYLGNYTYQQIIWYFYYGLINNAHSTIRTVDPAEASEAAKQYLGSALAYRAMAYLELSCMFEYKQTGVSNLDSKASAEKIYGLTVPIVSENTTEENSQNNPRAPFYKMYRFILNDLNRAEEYLADFTRKARNTPDLNVVYGLKARTWLEIATRFRLYPEDLSTQMSHESDSELQDLAPLGVSSAEGCYAKALEYAHKAINSGVYSPLTQDQWHNTTSGFNKSDSQNSWMLGIIIGTNSVNSNYKNFIGNISPETTFGVANYKYDTYRMISKSLFEQISDADWRKVTWIAPEDAGKAPTAKYHTLLSDEIWAKAPAYTGFKFRPGSGEMDTYKTGAATDVPVMRIEEMYFIEAEALAFTQSMEAGVSALEKFMNQYRYTDGSYECGQLAGIDEFLDKLMIQKRVEFWGEGIVYFDYKRLKMQVLRGYKGTNHVASQRFNSILGYVAPWLNIYITETEERINIGIINNPDPTMVIKLWSE